jgi:iron complex transport system ATP-binding protein
MVLVTHHVEEIMPAFSHVLILKRGRAIAGGPRRAVMQSKTLSAAFSGTVRLSRRAGRYSLRVAPAATRII